MNYNIIENELFCEWAKFLKVSSDEFVPDGLLFHGGMEFDNCNYVRTESGNNSTNWMSSRRKLLIITRDQPCDDGNIWDVRGETGLAKDGISLKKIQMFKCLIPWSYAALCYDKEDGGICTDDDAERLRFWGEAPIARINCGKVAGNRVKDGGCPREKVVDYLATSQSYMLRQISLYDANIIMCCSGYDTKSNPVVDFIKKYYLHDLFKVSNYLWYSKEKNKIVLDTYHFSNQSLWSDKAILEETKKIRDSIIDAKKKGYSID